MSQIVVSLQQGWECVVKKGDEIGFDSPLARLPTTQKDPHIIPIATLLSFKPANIFKHIKKNLGDTVYKGDVVAVKDSVFSTKKYIAEVEGVLREVNHHTGEITIDENLSASGSSQILAMIKGKVTEVAEDKVMVSVDKSLALPILTETTDRFGAGVIITDDTHAILLTLPEVRSNVVVSQRFSDYILSKLEALGVSHVVSAQALTQTFANATQLENPDDYSRIVDFAPLAVYANASEKTITFYR